MITPEIKGDLLKEIEGRLEFTSGQFVRIDIRIILTDDIVHLDCERTVDGEFDRHSSPRWEKPGFYNDLKKEQNTKGAPSFEQYIKDHE